MAQFRAAVARLVKPYRRDVAIGLLATAAANGFAVLIPLAFRAGIDGIVRHSVAAPLLFYGLAVIVLSGCKGWGDYLSHQCIAGMAQRIAYDLRKQISSHLQSLPPPISIRRTPAISCRERPPMSKGCACSSPKA
jgi:ABC-type multidrug transport system fused ATPase/permease subunit